MTILIDNFSIGVGDWVLVSDLVSFSVDAVDNVNTVLSGSSYFEREGSQVPTTFSGIANGFRMFYVPDSVVSSGTITLTAHVENDNSETAEQDFSLLYGFNILFDEPINWGPLRVVDVLVNATNDVLCPNTVGEGFIFTTADFPSVNLGATIRPVDSVDLGASIFPQSTAFFYGKTFTITVSGVKDFSGNIMAPYVLTFTIKDPTN